ncbi:hypothetical protein [Wolbachia endosymbiont of Glossina morsitans morsitans]|uniref:hypothetical protein n=1 Tax=Wolbachia endosymbiont of Glossina morsitans morsitans TaxID=1150948 RepID=UPI001F11EFBC|nr:hypothetical protein [Wolbachia endosymbiont of Glossina morsitans morsitans]
MSFQSGIQHFTQSHQERCILHNTFMLTNPVSNQNSWIPVSGHWDDKKKRYWYDIKE